MSYNGWRNRATWNVALWLDNDEKLYNAAREFRRRHGKLNAAAAKICCRELSSDATPDGDKLINVDWSTVANARSMSFK